VGWIRQLRDEVWPVEPDHSLTEERAAFYERRRQHFDRVGSRVNLAGWAIMLGFIAAAGVVYLLSHWL
jgi:hypothetical protein